MNHTDIASFMKSNTFVKALAAIGILIVAVFIFEAGVVVGFHKASFAYHWEKNYEHNFGSSGGPLMPGRNAPNPHGTEGKIVDVSLPTFVVAGQNENERTIMIGDDTIIRDGAATVSTDDLAVGKYVVVIGAPGDDGVVDAGFVRIMPAAATSSNPR